MPLAGLSAVSFADCVGAETHGHRHLQNHPAHRQHSKNYPLGIFCVLGSFGQGRNLGILFIFIELN